MVIVVEFESEGIKKKLILYYTFITLIMKNFTELELSALSIQVISF